MLVNTGSEFSPRSLVFFLIWLYDKQFQQLLQDLWNRLLTPFTYLYQKNPVLGKQTYVRLLSLTLSSVIPYISLHSIVIASSQRFYIQMSLKCEPFLSSHGKMLNYTVLQQQCHFTKLFIPSTCKGCSRTGKPSLLPSLERFLL